MMKVAGVTVFARRLLAGWLACVAAVVVVGAAPAAASAKVAPVARARVASLRVRVVTPAGVPVDVVVRGRRFVRVLGKGAHGGSASFVVVVPAGRVRVSVPAVVFQGSVFAPEPGTGSIVARVGRTVGVTVRLRRLPVAAGLRVTAVTGNAVALAWTAVHGAVVRLRERRGPVAPLTPGAGSAVHVGTGSARVAGLASGTQYSFALFTRVGGHWAAPVTVTVGTPSAAGASVVAAGYVAPASTVIVSPGQPYVPHLAGGVVSVTLPAGAPAPVLGAGFVLPISGTLPGGFVGKVTSISADGGTVTLAPAGLADVFTAYNLDVAVPDDVPAQALRVRAGSRRPLGAGCGPGVGVSEALAPAISFGGTTLSVSLLTKDVLGVRIPVTAEFSLHAKAQLRLSAQVSASGEVSCQLVPAAVVVNLPTDPVPMAIVMNPVVGITTGGEESISGVSETVNLGFGVDGAFGAKDEFSPSFSASASETGDPAATSSGDLEATVGGQFTIGPGGGTPDAGVIAGVSGQLELLDAKLDVTPAAGGHGACLSAALGGDADLGLSARAWLGSLSESATWTLLNRSWNYVPATYHPAGCNTASTPAPGGTTTTGTTPTGTGGTGPGGAPSPAGAISAGWLHTCALASGGTVDCWGDNGDGELGDGTFGGTDGDGASDVPVQVQGITDATAVTAGYDDTCALLSGGTVDCWGYNGYGELGDGTGGASDVPVQVQGITDATAVTAGDDYTCALLSGGTVDCWGDNGYGELGDGTFGGTDDLGLSSDVPVQVQGITDATAVTAGSDDTCALLSGGTVDCWGYNAYGELGDGTDGDGTGSTSSDVPVAVVGFGGP